VVGSSVRFCDCDEVFRVSFLDLLLMKDCVLINFLGVQ
jgi:hypothetical protein